MLHPALGSSAQESLGSVGGDDSEGGTTLIELGSYSLEKSRLQDILTVAFQYLSSTRKMERLFTRICSDRTKANGFKPNTVGLDYKKIIHCMVDEALEQVVQGSSGCLILEALKNWLGGTLNSLVK